MKKIALFLCFVMLFTASTFAASTNSVSREGGAYKEYTPLGFMTFNIRPLDEVTTGSSIILTFETAKVFDQSVIDGTSTDTNALGYNSTGYQYSYYDWNSTQGFYDVMPQVSTNQLPYKIRRINDNQIEVNLINVPSNYAGGNLLDINGVNNEPYYSIPCVVYTYGTGDVKVTIDSNSSTITGGIILSGSTNSGKKDTTTTVTNNESTTETTTETVSETTTESNVTKFTNTVKATVGSNILVVNNSNYTIDTAPFIQKSSSSTLIPLRAVTTSLTGKDENSDIVTWDAETKTATINYGGNKIQFTAGSEYVTINGKSQKMAYGVYAEIKDSRMFVPFRTLGEAVGAKVDWDAETKTAIFN